MLGEKIMFDKIRSNVNDALSKINGYRGTSFNNNTSINNRFVPRNERIINKYDYDDEMNYSDEAFNAFEKNNNVSENARINKLELQEKKMQDDYDKRHSETQFNLGEMSSMGFQSSVNTENLDEQITIVDNNISLYNSYMDILNKEISTLDDFINSIDWLNLGNVFPRMLYDSNVNMKFDDILYILQYLGLEEENINYETYRDNIRNNKYLPYMSEFINGSTLEDYINFNIVNALQIIGDETNFYVDFESKPSEFGGELSEEFLQQNYIYRPGFFNDYYNNTVFRQLSFGIFGELYSEQAKKYAYYSYELGKTIDDLKNDLSLYLGCSVDELSDAFLENKSDDINKWLLSLEKDFYNKKLDDYCKNNNFSLSDLTNYFVEHYKQSIASGVSDSVYRDQFISELIIQLNFDESMLINSTNFKNYKAGVGDYYINYLGSDLICEKYTDVLKNELYNQLMTLRTDYESIKKISEVLEVKKLDLELNKLIDPSDFSEYSKNVPDFILNYNYIGVNTISNPLNEYINNMFLMTDVEKEKFYYFYNKYGSDTALEYYSVIVEELNSRHGLLDTYNWFANNFIDGIEPVNSVFDLTNDKIELLKEKIANKYDDARDMNQLYQDLKLIGHDFIDSFDSFDDGFTGFLSSGVTSAEDFERMYFSMFLSGNKNASMAHEIVSSVGNLIIPMTVSVVNPILGSTLLALSSAGSSYDIARQEGYNFSESLCYGLLTGLSEAAMEKFFGGIPGMSIFDDIPGVKGTLIRTMMEAPEEQSQMFVDLFLRRQILGENAYIDWDEFAKTGVYAMITAGILNGGKLVIDGMEVDLNYISPEVIERAINENDMSILNDYVKLNQNDNIVFSEKSEETIFGESTEISSDVSDDIIQVDGLSAYEAYCFIKDNFSDISKYSFSDDIYVALCKNSEYSFNISNLFESNGWVLTKDSPKIFKNNYILLLKGLENKSIKLSDIDLEFFLDMPSDVLLEFKKYAEPGSMQLQILDGVLFDNVCDKYFNLSESNAYIKGNILNKSINFDEFSYIINSFPDNIKQINFSNLYKYIEDYSLSDINKMIDCIKKSGRDIKLVFPLSREMIDSNFLKGISDLDFIIFSSVGNLTMLTGNEILKTNQNLELYVKDIKESNLSPYEKYIAVYNIVKSFKEYNFYEFDDPLDQKYGDQSRSIYLILENDWMVCVGFANLLSAFLTILDIPSISYCWDEQNHQINYVCIKDEKYGVDTIIKCDSTNDNTFYNILNSSYYEVNQEISAYKTPFDNFLLGVDLDSMNTEEIYNYIIKLDPSLSKYSINDALKIFRDKYFENGINKIQKNDLINAITSVNEFVLGRELTEEEKSKVKFWVFEPIKMFSWDFKK